jgi:hypothetical protein
MTATVLLLVLVCGASAHQALAQAQKPSADDGRLPDWAAEIGRAGGGGQFEMALVDSKRASGEVRKKVEEISRMADSEFDRGRESGHQRALRAEEELKRSYHFSALSEDDKATLAPPAEDAAQFASFLSQPDTGLVRLLPRDPKNFNGRLSVRGGGAYYSFAHLVHEYNYGSDVGLEQGHFLAGFAGASYGLLFDLGDVPLADVTTETGPVKFLASFSPPPLEAEARKIQSQLHDGYQDGWFVYRRSIPTVVGHTYALRSVDYEMSDVLVAFRVLREDEENGGVIILWRMLKRFPEPRLESGTANR